MKININISYVIILVLLFILTGIAINNIDDTVHSSSESKTINVEK